jgi:hypothetical protein
MLRGGEAHVVAHADIDGAPRGLGGIAGDAPVLLLFLGRFIRGVGGWAVRPGGGSGQRQADQDGGA